MCKAAAAALSRPAYSESPVRVTTAVTADRSDAAVAPPPVGRAAAPRYYTTNFHQQLTNEVKLLFAGRANISKRARRRRFMIMVSVKRSLGRSLGRSVRH